MICGVRARKVRLKAPHKKALALIKETIRANGFEVSEVVDLNAFLRRRTGTCLNKRTMLIEVCHPTTLLEGILTDNPMPLLLPVRIVIQETNDNACVIHLPEWDAGQEPDGVTVHHCLNLLYTEMVIAIARAIEDLPEKERQVSSIQPVGHAAWGRVANETGTEGRFRRREP